MPTIKRSRSPSPNGRDAKRRITVPGTSMPALSNLFPFQEIFLRILSFLHPLDLASVQGVSRYWARMSLDPQLWKTMYLRDYTHPHGICAPNTCNSTDKIAQGDPVKTPTPTLSRRSQFPSRAFPPPSPSPLRSTSLGVGSRNVGEKGKGKQIEEEDVVRHEGVNWKKLLIMRTNWQQGNALSQSTTPLPPSPSSIPPRSVHSTFPAPSLPEDYPHPHVHFQGEPQAQHLALSPSLIFTSSPISPLVYCYTSLPPFDSREGLRQVLCIIPPPPGWSSPSRPDCVTAICSDQAVGATEEAGGREGRSARLAIFYQSGGFVVLSTHISPSQVFTWKRTIIQPPSTRPLSIRRQRQTAYATERGDPVVLAVMYGRLLGVCTKGFYVNVYDLEDGSGSGKGMDRPRCLGTMHSDEAFHPASLSLFPSVDHGGNHQEGGAGVSDFEACLTYSTPVYPSSWTLAIQSFHISLPSSSSSSPPAVARGDSYHVSPPSSSTDEDDFTWPRVFRPVVGVKRVRAVGSDGRWSVLAGDGDKLEVFSMPLLSPQSSLVSSINKEERKMAHAQTLLTHSSVITSLELDMGKCVGAGSDGRVLVWELDRHLASSREQEEGGMMGRTAGYVEVKKGGRKLWKGASGPLYPQLDTAGGADDDSDRRDLPHPQAISSAARSLFLPRPPLEQPPETNPKWAEERKSIRFLAFDEEKIAGVVVGGKEDELKVWNFG